MRRRATGRSLGRWQGISAVAGIAVVATLLGGSALSGQEEGAGDEEAAEGGTDTKQGVFSDEQATRGEDVFWNICAECHFEEDFGGPFIRSWTGASVKDLVDEITATMPEDNPGGLPAEQYVDFVSWVFRYNGLPAGDDELTADVLGEVEIAVVEAEDDPDPDP